MHALHTQRYLHTYIHSYQPTDEQEDQDGDGHHEGGVAVESDGLDHAGLEETTPPSHTWHTPTSFSTETVHSQQASTAP